MGGGGGGGGCVKVRRQRLRVSVPLSRSFRAVCRAVRSFWPGNEWTAGVTAAHQFLLVFSFSRIYTLVGAEATIAVYMSSVNTVPVLEALYRRQ